MIDQTIKVAGPEFTCTLNPWEVRIEPLYSKRVLCFASDGGDRELATSVLKDALQCTVNQIPTLAGEFVDVPPGKNPQKGQRTIRHGGHALLKTKDLTNEIDFDVLRREEFPQSMLRSDLVDPMLPRADATNAMPMFVLGANFVKGGLLLVFCIHHAVMDGRGITKAIKLFAENCFGVQESLNTKVPYNPEPLDKALLDRSPLCRDFGTSTDGHCFMEASKSRWASDIVIPEYFDTVNHKVVCQAFQLSAQAQKSLKAEAASQLPVTDDVTFVSTQDAISALVFRGVANARYAAGWLKEDDVIEMVFPIDMRSKLQPPLPAEALYNAVYIVAVKLPLEDMLGPNGLGLTAGACRRAIQTTDSERFYDCMAYLQSRPHARDTVCTFGEDILRTQMMLTSYNKFDIYGIKWPSAIGTFERFRLPSGGVVNGMHVVYPAQFDGSCDLAITLDKEVMDEMKNLEEWKRYTVAIDKEVVQ